MDFKRVLKKLVDAFEKDEINYGLIGGFALGIYGVVRATADLDFLIDKKHEAFLKKIMRQNMYEISHESGNVIQFEHPAGIFGSIDFLYAFRRPSLEMLKRVVQKKILGGTITMKVLIPEDIIGLKVQAFVNQPERKIFELEDIKNLILANLDNLDWGIIKKHFVLFNLNTLYRELKDSYAAEK